MKKTSGLGKLQKEFFDSVRVPLNAKNRLSVSDRKKELIRSMIKPNDRLSSEDRLEIYARQYWFRIIDSLYDDFPGLRALMGDRKFDRVIRDYIEKKPSRSYTLRNFGNRFPDYLLRRKKEWGTHAALYLQMAEMELAQLHVFDEADPIPLTSKMIGAKPLSQRFQMAPHVRIFRLDYPLDELQVGLNRGGVREQLSNGVVDRSLRLKCKSVVGKLKKQKVYLAVHRYEFKVYFKRLEPWAYELLQSLHRGDSLGKSIETALRNHGDSVEALAGKVSESFQEWSSLGWIQIRKLK